LDLFISEFVLGDIGDILGYETYWEWDFSDRNWNAAGCAWRIDRWG